MRSHYRVLALALAAAACGDASGPPTDTSGPVRLDSVRLAPVVTAPGEAFTLALKVARAGGPTVIAHPLTSPGLVRDGAALDSLVLHDDGSHGDAAAGDGWYTLDGLVLPPGPAGVAAVSLVQLSDLHESGAGHQDREISLRVSFRTADPAVVGTPAVTVVDDDARATTRVVSLLRDDAAALDEGSLADVVLRYYALLPDDRDFLVVFAPPTVGEAWSARAYQLRNDVAGIGLDLARWRDWGADRLSLVVHTRMAVWASAGNFCLLNHELSHRWLAYVGSPLAASGHWLPELDRDTSVQGDSVGCLMNDLELYLAGFLPADSVGDPLGLGGYRMVDLLAGQGFRSPAHDAAPRDFALRFVVVSDAPLTHHELAWFHFVAGEYTAPASELAPNWAAATGGRSSLTAEP